MEIYNLASSGSTTQTTNEKLVDSDDSRDPSLAKGSPVYSKIRDTQHPMSFMSAPSGATKGLIHMQQYYCNVAFLGGKKWWGNKYFGQRHDRKIV